MIMFYLTNLEMSALMGAILSFLEGGQYGRKGHYHVKPEGIKTVTHNSQSI